MKRKDWFEFDFLEFLDQKYVCVDGVNIALLCWKSKLNWVGVFWMISRLLAGTNGAISTPPFAFSSCLFLPTNFQKFSWSKHCFYPLPSKVMENYEQVYLWENNLAFLWFQYQKPLVLSSWPARNEHGHEHFPSDSQEVFVKINIIAFFRWSLLFDRRTLLQSPCSVTTDVYSHILW